MPKNKVTIPRDVAEALSRLEKAGYGSITTVNIADSPLRYRASLEHHGVDADAWALRNYLVSGNGDAFLQALVNGYEIERSPHEELREYYEVLKECEDTAWSGALFRRQAVEKTLRILGITVEGINDQEDV